MAYVSAGTALGSRTTPTARDSPSAAIRGSLLRLVELALLFCRRVLVLLVLADEVVHVRLGLCSGVTMRGRLGRWRGSGCWGVLNLRQPHKTQGGSGWLLRLRSPVNSISSMPSPVYQ